MKKILLSFSALIVVANLNAQITITQWDIAAVGKQLITAHDTTHENHPGAINPGSSGANQTWTFTILKADSTDTITFTNPAWLPNASTFPNSNLAIINSGDGSQTYLENTPSGLFADGVYGNLGAGFMTVPINPSREVDSFPDHYGNSFLNTSKIDFKFAYNMPPVDSVHVKQVVNQDVKTDGWGNIITPLGTYASLRHRAKVITTDTIWLRYSGNWIAYQATIDTNWHFSWWANSVGYALLEFDSLKADTVRNISWLKVAPFVGAVNEISLMNGITIFPNPAVNQINFEMKNPAIASLEIFDLAGNKISAMPANKKEIISFDTAALPNGVYFFRTTDSEGKTLNRGKFDIAK